MACQQKITPGEMRAPAFRGAPSGVRGLLVYCSNHHKCAHSLAISADRWPDHVRLPDLETHFVYQKCGHRMPTSGSIMMGVTSAQ